MIDLHCHILPGIDDGAQTMEDSLLMAEKAVEQGIHHLLCTPHHNNGRYDNPAQIVIPKVAALQAEIDRQNIDLTVYEGQEVRLTDTLLTDIEKGRILFTDLTNKYILIEFPTRDIPLFTEQIFFELLSRGHIPVIVHPERNSKFREDPNRLLPFLEMGVLTQLTAPSIVGVFGKAIQKTARQMLNHNMIYMVASDAHGISTRNFYLKEAYEVIAQEFGEEQVSALQQAAKNLLNGEDVAPIEWQAVRRKRFGFF